MSVASTWSLPPRRSSLADDLCEGLVALIHHRDLQPGDHFESVKSLATHFQVAVPTLREALRRLEATGMIELRHGSGVYVGPHVRRLVLPNPLTGAPTVGQLLALLEARLIFEPPIAATAAAVRDENGIHRMTETLAEAERCVAERDERLWVVNLDFHRALAATAGNPVIAEVVESLLVVHALEQREILRIHGDVHQDLDEHRAIADAITGGDADAAARLTDEHLRSVMSLIRRRLESAEA